MKAWQSKALSAQALKLKHRVNVARDHMVCGVHCWGVPQCKRPSQIRLVDYFNGQCDRRVTSSQVVVAAHQLANQRCMAMAPYMQRR